MANQNSTLTKEILHDLFEYKDGNLIRKKTNTTLLHLNNELDEANKIKAKFFAIISHDLRSPIANLVSFLNLKKDTMNSVFQ
jgi:signal transduction histidine kinase